MTVLRFGSEEALRFTVQAGLVPAALLASPAVARREPGGAVRIASELEVEPEARARLVAAGVVAEEGELTQGKRVASWAEVLPVARGAPIPEELGHVLFVVPEGAGFVDLAGELLRLGCDRLEWRTAGATHLLRAAAPPYYVLLRAEEGSVRAFVASPAERVWMHLGCEHPLAHLLSAPDGAIALVGPEGVELVPDGPFADIFGLVDLKLPEPPRLRAAAPPPRLTVPLRLARGAATAMPSLWRLPSEGLPALQRLAAATPEEALRDVLFAALGDAGFVLRTRPGAPAASALALGEAFVAHPAIANLYLPEGHALEPPLRRDRVQELLVPDPDEVAWLRLAPPRFVVERTTEAAFRPLSELVDYVVDAEVAKLAPWIASATFDFGAYVGVDAPPAVPVPPAAAPRKRARKAEPAPAPEPRQVEARTVVTAAPLSVDDATRELAELERAFLEAPSLDLWDRMATLNARLGHAHDAAVAWAHCAWEGRTDVHRAWLEAARKDVHGASLVTLLAVETPSAAHVRAAAVSALSGDTPADMLQAVSLWLDLHDRELDVRTAWLARVELARRLGGDRLGLARARDRLLARIHHGLSLARDLPSFFRRAGRDAAQAELLGGRLEQVLEAFDRTKRKRSATEADPKLTQAYVRFVVGYGLARLGRVHRAAELRDLARKALPPDPVHGFLSEAFTVRIGQALEGRSAEEPLPPALEGALGALAKLERYKVDRVRQASSILEPHERLHPSSAFWRGEADPRGPEFAGLRGAADVTDAIAGIVAKAAGEGPAERARLHDGAMDFFVALPREQATAHLAVIAAGLEDVPVARRVELLDKVLGLAGHLGEMELARRTFAALEPAVASVGADGAAAVAPLASGMLRALRRFGLRDDAQRLLTSLQAAARGRTTAHLVARLHTASALAYLGELDRARPVYEEALGVLSGDLPVPDRLKLTRALARGLAPAPIEYATAGLDQALRSLVVVTDSYNTNTHVCLSVVDFVESIVLGYASEDLAFDHGVRSLIDQDELAVRLRIHAET